MIETITLHAFDLAVNPIILCETDGRIIYKNPESVSKIRKPIKGKNIKPYLTEKSRTLLGDVATKEHFPAILEIESEGENHFAFADILYYESRPVLLLTVSHLFRYELSLPFFVSPPSVLREKITGERLARLMTRLYTSENMLSAARNRKYHSRMTEVYYKLTERLITELAYGKDRIHYPLAYAVDILSYASDKVFSPLGLDVFFDLLYEDANMMLIDFKTFTLLVSNVIICAAEVSEAHMITVRVERDEDDGVILSFFLSVPHPQANIPLGGTNRFADLLPGRTLDLFFFDALCADGKYRFDFTVNQKSENNLRIRLYAPIFRRYLVHARDNFKKDDAYRLIDHFLKDQCRSSD